jgi:hypothetical protein
MFLDYPISIHITTPDGVGREWGRKVMSSGVEFALRVAIRAAKLLEDELIHQIHIGTPLPVQFDPCTDRGPHY